MPAHGRRWAIFDMKLCAPFFGLSNIERQRDDAITRSFFRISILFEMWRIHMQTNDERHAKQ